MSDPGQRRMTAAQLRDFVENQMQMRANYQPVIIRSLVLARDGRLPAETLAKNLMLSDRAQVGRTRVLLMRMPAPVLARRGVTHYDRSSGEFELLVDFDSEDEKSEVVRLCDQKIEEWNRSNVPLGPRSASRDVKVFERARWRCELCGVTAKDVPLQIDHIVPRSRRDRTDHVVLHGKRLHFDDIENLQSLCGRCNQGKSNTRQEDYRPSVDWLAESIAHSLRLAKHYGFDTRDVMQRVENQLAARPTEGRTTDT